MKIKKIVIHAIIICAILGASLGVYQKGRSEKETLWIALAAPMSGASNVFGEEVKQAIDLYLDRANQEEWLHGRQIKVRVFDDKNKAKNAMQVASEIAASKDILITLGHYSSGASVAAGRIYRKNAIPAITASATADRVTTGNQWYYRVIPNNAVQSSFIANYIKNILNETSVSIISTVENTYASDMARNFKKAAEKIGLAVNRTWQASPESGQMEQDLRKIIIELRSVKKPGMIFIAASNYHSPQIIALLKHAVGDYTVIGADTFTTSAFLNAFQNYPREQEAPGYYTNGIFATTHILFDTANKTAMRFRKEFLKRYNREPSWVGACYYDAMHVAVEAIQKAEINGRDNIRKKRDDIRAALASINC